MANLNKVLLIGNLTRDPELRYLADGTAVCEFGIAINRKYKTPSGEQKEDVTFVDITAWRKQAEVISEYLSKGRAIFLEGRLKTDQWTTPEGEKRSRLRVVLDRFEFLDPRQGSGQGGGERRGPVNRPQGQAARPAGSPVAPQAPQAPKPAPEQPPPPDNDFDSQEESIPF